MGSYRHGLAATLAALLWSLCGNAAAQPVAMPMKQPVKVVICGNGGEVDITLHPDLITTLYFPLPIDKTYAADTERFTFWVHGPRLRIRPTANAEKDLQTSAEIIAGDQVITLRLRVIHNPDEVPLRWEFIMDQGLCSRAPPLMQALLARYLAHLFKSSLVSFFRTRSQPDHKLGRIEAHRPAPSRPRERSPSPFPPRNAVLSVQVQGTLGAARLGDDMAQGRTAVAPMQGIRALFGYRPPHSLIYEFELAFARLNRLEFPDTSYGEDHGTLARHLVAGRAHAGVRFHRGIDTTSSLRRLSASLHLGAGAHWRRSFDSRLIMEDKAVVEGPPEVTYWNLSVGMGVDINYAISTRFSAGAGAVFIHSSFIGQGPAFRSLEAIFHVGWKDI